MYSKKKTQAILNAFSSREGWMPTYHTLEEVDEFKAYVASIVNIESNSRSTTITLNKSISTERQEHVRKWIENEQVLCSADYSYWESRYAYVLNEKGEMVKFKNRASQTMMESIIADLDEKGLSKDLIILGSRQNGTDTKFTLMCIHRALFSPNSGVLLSSASPARNELIGKVTDAAYNHCPWWLVPLRLPKNKFSNHSVISIQTSPNIAHGLTPNCVFISNAEEFRNPVKTFEEGLFRATFSSITSMLVIHGSMPQDSTWLRSIWNYSKEYYPKGMSRFMPVFIPWYASSDIYPAKEWINRFPVPEKWIPAKETKEHVSRCELYVRNTPMLSKAMGKGWKMPVEQKWFWEYSYNYAKAVDTLERFLSMMAADDSDQLDHIEVAEGDMDLDEMFPDASATQKKMECGK